VPDDKGSDTRGWLAGDTRAALTPFLAYEAASRDWRLEDGSGGWQRGAGAAVQAQQAQGVQQQGQQPGQAQQKVQQQPDVAAGATGSGKSVPSGSASSAGVAASSATGPAGAPKVQRQAPSAAGAGAATSSTPAATSPGSPAAETAAASSGTASAGAVPAQAQEQAPAPAKPAASTGAAEKPSPAAGTATSSTGASATSSTGAPATSSTGAPATSSTGAPASSPAPPHQDPERPHSASGASFMDELKSLFGKSSGASGSATGIGGQSQKGSFAEELLAMVADPPSAPNHQGEIYQLVNDQQLSDSEPQEEAQEHQAALAVLAEDEGRGEGWQEGQWYLGNGTASEASQDGTDAGSVGVGGSKAAGGSTSSSNPAGQQQEKAPSSGRRHLHQQAPQQHQQAPQQQQQTPQQQQAPFKWMLYGDDDTLWHMPGVLRLLQHYDPELPYAISDYFWYADASPSVVAPRCLPCHFKGTAAVEVGRPAWHDKC
jgi:hypothetical protein